MGHFCPPDPDPDSGSGSTGPSESGSNPDPDPKKPAIFYICGSFLPSWIRIRIQQLKLMRIHEDPDSQPWSIFVISLTIFQEHGELFSAYSEHHPAKKDLLTELLKMVMVVPFADKVVPAEDVVPAPPTSTEKIPAKEPTVSSSCLPVVFRISDVLR